MTSVPPAMPRSVGINPPATGTAWTGAGVFVDAAAILTGVGVLVAFGVVLTVGVAVGPFPVVGVGVGVRDGAPGGVQHTYPAGSALQSATTSYLPSAKHVAPGMHWFGSSQGPGVGVLVGVGVFVAVGVGVFVGVPVGVDVTVGVGVAVGVDVGVTP